MLYGAGKSYIIPDKSYIIYRYWTLDTTRCAGRIDIITEKIALFTGIGYDM